MEQLFKNYLFGKHVLVSDGTVEHPFEVIFALAKHFGIRITEGAELANVELIRFAEDRLGMYVPLAFYKNFPKSVRRLTREALLFDQLVHYTVTYGFGHTEEAGHSLFEENFDRLAFDEETKPKKFIILNEASAEERLKEYVLDMLSSSRPLSDEQYLVLSEFISNYGFQVEKCVCKETALRLLFDTRDLKYAAFLSLSDTVKLVDMINFREYENKNPKKLNLKNTDRKFITAVLDSFFQGHLRCNFRDCFEKRAVWCGLLHHIHYKPKNDTAKAFLDMMRGGENQSVYSEFEREMTAKNIEAAVNCIRTQKGSGALLRNLNYILSRCENEKEIRFVIESLEAKKPIILIQLMIQYANYVYEGKRIFRFTKYNKLRVHEETKEEANHRKSTLSDSLVCELGALMKEKLGKMLKGKLGRVYISPDAYNVALPLQETATSGGFGVLPKGSRIHLEDGKKLRAFTYWEKVDDIDLAVIGVKENGEQREFSWRTMYNEQSDEITYSGDQTSGYKGGSEYFDVDLAAFAAKFPTIRYLVFTNNVFSNFKFNECICRAGYMIRDIEDTGEIFEPKTVKSSFAINCDSTFAYLFGIDLKRRDFIWLNANRDSSAHIAGESQFGFLINYFKATDVINLGSLLEMMATEKVNSAEEADVIVSDEDLDLADGKTQIHSYDFEKITALIK